MRKFTRLSKSPRVFHEAPPERRGAPRITVIDYDDKHLQEKEVKNPESCFRFKRTKTVSWINIDGIHDHGLIEKMGTGMDLHPIVLENIMNRDQRPMIEDFGDHIFVVLKMLYFDDREKLIKFEHVSIIFGKTFVITFQEGGGDVFGSVRERIRNPKSRIRKHGTDYLAYALIDAIVENYFIILEKFGEMVEGIEEELVSDPKMGTLRAIHELKREMLFLRKSAWPLREVIDRMEKTESNLIRKTTGIYLRSVYDHTIQVIDTAEILRETLSGMLDIYLSSISNKLNEVMKVLTIIATIFIPLTFIAGVYGMNFRHMPELEWAFGYPMALSLMLGVGILLLIYFRRKKWM
jgi:magnesium transporter